MSASTNESVRLSTDRTLFIAGKVEWWPDDLPDDEDSIATRVGHCIVADLLDTTFPDGMVVYVRTCVDDTPIDPGRFLDLAVLAMEGALHADYYYSRGYSEYTPGELTEEIKVGGHDLQDWIADNEDRYVAILVSDTPMPDLADALERATRVAIERGDR